MEITIYQQLKDAGVKGIYLHGDKILAAPRLEDFLKDPIVQKHLLMITTPTLNGPQLGYVAWEIAPDVMRTPLWSKMQPASQIMLMGGVGHAAPTAYEAVARLLLAKKSQI